MAALFVIFIFAFIILSIVAIIWAILDIFQRNLELSEKLLWTILIILAPIIGTTIYLTLGRQQKRSF